MANLTQKATPKVQSKQREEVLQDFKWVCESRHASVMGRREVFMGKAKFGIFGDGKELAQVALAKVFRKGDWRSGYYRDQTLMFATGEVSYKQFFAQLYAHTDVRYEPSTGGRLMNVHFGSRGIDSSGQWHDQTLMRNIATDMSPTSIQMARAVGLAYASKLYRNYPVPLPHIHNFSREGNELCIATIGDGASAEGIFFEAINAAAVLQIPLLTCVWDDGYAISTPIKYQMAKESVSKALEGMQRNDQEKGIEILTVKGWDYEGLCHVYRYAESICREEHVPVLVHVYELTQPQGHSTSGSHERYKSRARLEWEKEHDCLLKFKQWIIEQGLATPAELEDIDDKAHDTVKKARDEAWNDFQRSMRVDFDKALALLDKVQENSQFKSELESLRTSLYKTINPTRLDTVSHVRKALRVLAHEDTAVYSPLLEFHKEMAAANVQRYNANLYSEGELSPLQARTVPVEYDHKSPLVDGREVLNACFDRNFSRDPTLVALGEDVGKIGDVNQGFAGLQAKYGEARITDTGIRETTIMGQGLGLALRGFRPIVEIQYLDYIIYGIEPLCDDLASLHYRSAGGHKAPVIVRTRGHRLEGVWHSGSPMGMLVHAMRGLYLCVPRNMTQAAGMYNLLLRSDSPAVVVETLNGYRKKERMPSNIGEFTVPLGVPDVLLEGSDITLVTYGAMCSLTLEAAATLQELGIHAEVIDVQTLLPFDTTHRIAQSIKKTGRVLFMDEDVPGGATSYMMQQVLEVQGAYYLLDSPPATLTAQAHRPAYSSDGDYFSKPSVDDIFDAVYRIMHETDPRRFPALYGQ